MTVYLVGAGPGDPGLITVRGAEVMASAEVIVHDRLADSRLLSLAQATARLIDVGKAPGGPVQQDEINRILIAEGSSGRAVVRLKGGDPFVFGRGARRQWPCGTPGSPSRSFRGLPPPSPCRPTPACPSPTGAWPRRSQW